MDGQSRGFSIELNETCDQLSSQSDDQVSEDDIQTRGDIRKEVDFGISGDYMVDIPKPKVGMKFQTDSEAYEFYSHYAKHMGFKVRKNSTTHHRTNKTVSRSLFCCSKEGFQRTHTRGPSLKARPPTRVGCKARFQIKLQDGIYSVVEFIKEHNHELESGSKDQALRLQGKIQSSQAEVLENMNHERTGSIISHSHITTSAEVGAFPNLNSTQSDCTAHMQGSINEVLQKGDAQFLLQYMQRMQKENPYFVYSIHMSDNNQLGCCFWCDAKSRIDYSFFGDVVCFDTTYKTNDYEKPYTPFVGLNNHGQFILFGCALLLDETVESFIWLFQTFLEAMNGKQPKTIFTEQTMPITKAVQQVFLNTHHRLCLIHIYQDSMKHLHQVSVQFTSFAEDLKMCIYDGKTEEEFQSSWDHLLDKYTLVENEWLQDLYQMRQKWVPAYGREHFCAGMTTIKRSEGMSKFLRKYLKRFLPLQEFVFQYERALNIQREKEKDQDLISKQTKPELRTMWPAEARAAEQYTRKIFTSFQDEYVGTLDLLVEVASEDGSRTTYKVSSFAKVNPCSVTFDNLNNTIKCSCKQFEFVGILCAHALKVLHSRRSLDIPLPYYLNRWTKDARVGVVVDNRGQLMHINGSSSLALRHSELVHTALTLAAKAASSEKSSAYSKEKLAQLLDEIDDLLKTS